MNKKKLIMIIASCVVALVLAIILIIVLTKKDDNGGGEKELDDHKIVEIRYSVGGGFGTIEDVATRHMTFTIDGKLVYSNEYDSTTKEVDFGRDKFKKLCDYINENFSVFENGVEEDRTVLDGGSSHLYIKLKDGKEYEVGGYMVSDKTYKKIVSKIIDSIDYEEFREYDRSIGKDK